MSRWSSRNGAQHLAEYWHKSYVQLSENYQCNNTLDTGKCLAFWGEPELILSYTVFYWTCSLFLQCSCPQCSLAQAICTHKLLVDVCVVMQLGMLFLQCSCLWCSLTQAYNIHSKILVDVSLLSIVSVHYTVSRQRCSSSLYADSVNQRVAQGLRLLESLLGGSRSRPASMLGRFVPTVEFNVQRCHLLCIGTRCYWLGNKFYTRPYIYIQTFPAT